MNVLERWYRTFNFSAKENGEELVERCSTRCVFTRESTYILSSVPRVMGSQENDGCCLRMCKLFLRRDGRISNSVEELTKKRYAHFLTHTSSPPADEMYIS